MPFRSTCMRRQDKLLINRQTQICLYSELQMKSSASPPSCVTQPAGAKAESIWVLSTASNPSLKKQTLAMTKQSTCVCILHCSDSSRIFSQPFMIVSWSRCCLKPLWPFYSLILSGESSSDCNNELNWCSPNGNMKRKHSCFGEHFNSSVACWHKNQGCSRFN